MSTHSQARRAQKCSMATIRRAYAPGEGRHWFDAGSMNFFRSRLPRLGYRAAYGDAYYFVSSEQCGWDGERRYTVREMKRDSDAEAYSIDSRGGFQAYATREQADACAYAYAMTSGAPAARLAAEVKP